MRLYYNGILLLISFFFFSACVFIPMPEPIAIATHPYEFPGFTIKPPHGSDWYINLQTENGILFKKKTDRGNDRIIIALAHIERFSIVVNSFDDLMRYVDYSFNLNNECNKNFKIEKRKLNFRGYDAVAIDFESQDICVPWARGDVFFMRGSGIIIPHPDAPHKKVVYIGYTHRVRRGLMFMDITNELQPFYDSLVLNRIPK